MPKKKPIKAVALTYERQKDDAPRVGAKGQGRIAEKIIEIAKQHNLPIKDDPDLIEVLSSLDIDQQIPAELYVAVAELLAFIYSLNSEKGRNESRD